MQVCIIDYGMGNINSITNALNYLGITWSITNSRKEIENFSHLILPGVGSYKVAMSNLNKLDLVDGIKELGLIKKKKNFRNLFRNAASWKFKHRRWIYQRS